MTITRAVYVDNRTGIEHAGSAPGRHFEYRIEHPVLFSSDCSDEIRICRWLSLAGSIAVGASLTGIGFSQGNNTMGGAGLGILVGYPLLVAGCVKVCKIYDDCIPRDRYTTV